MITRKTFKWILISICFAISLSCEYDNDDDNYHEIPQPKPIEDMKFDVNLRYYNTNDTIYIYGKTDFFIDVESETEVLSLESKIIGYDEMNYGQEITVDPSYWYKKKNKLGIRMVVKSNTNSLANHEGLESYEKTKTYNIEYLTNELEKTSIKHRKSTDGYIELYWDKTSDRDLEISIGYNDVYKLEKGQTSFVDKTYTTGERFYSLRSIGDSWDYTSYSINEYNPKIEYESEHNILKWNKSPYKCKYVIAPEYGEPIYTEETNVKLDYSMLNESYVYFYVLPYEEPYKNYLSFNSFTHHITPPLLKHEYRIMVGDTLNNKIIAVGNYSNTIDILDAGSLKTISTVNLNNNLDELSIYNDKIAISSGNKTNVYKNNNFTELLYTVKGRISRSSLTDNKLFTFDNYNIYVYNSDNGELLFSKEEGYIYEPEVSTNGKYVLLKHSYQNAKLYKITENQIIEVEEYQDIKKNIFFNPNNYDEIFWPEENKIKVYNIPTKTFTKIINGEFIFYDVFTGNSLFMDANYIINKKYTVFSSDFNNVITQIELDNNYYSNYRLINNYVINNRYYKKLDL